jgi:hypothetical protein
VLPNICLCLHCIKAESMPEPRAHRELFIGLADLEELILSLKAEGYRFTLPGDADKADGPVCSLTFDDGYFNSSLFVETAEKHAIPFILFVTSYNVIHRVPFIWDIWEASRAQSWPVSSVDYGKLYGSLEQAEKDLLNNGTHRPLTAEEMGDLSAHPLVHFAPHGHTHQPMVGPYIEHFDQEIGENLSFLSGFKNALTDDFSLPCGLHTRRLTRKLLARFKRIYTIDGGGFSPQDRIINRISLINPEVGGPLRDQIRQSFSAKARLLRKAINIRYSNRLLYRI